MCLECEYSVRVGLLKSCRQKNKQIKCTERERMLLGRLHEGKFERTRLKLGPAQSADIDGKVQAFRIKASGFRDVFMKLQYPPKRCRRHLSGERERERRIVIMICEPTNLALYSLCSVLCL